MSNEYLKQKMQRAELILRLWLGIHVMINRKFNLVKLAAIVCLYVAVWRSRGELLNYIALPDFLLQSISCFISLSLVVMMVLFLLIWIKKLGIKAARHDEGCLAAAFTVRDLQNGHPVLISKHTEKSTNVTIREFYTKIPFSRWQAMKDDIADFLNVSFVSPEITYGGRNQDKSYRIVLHTVPNRKLKERGELYDEEL